MIEVYPSKLEGEPLERHKTTQRMTIFDWLQANVKGFERRDAPPISAHLNGELIEQDRWDSVEFSPSDTLAFYPEPKGAGALFYAAAVVVAAVAISIALQPSISKPKQNNQGKGDDLNEARLRGNRVKINAPIREVAGKVKVYPDYLLPIHRYFESPRVQRVEALLCVGKGEFDAPLSKVLIGDTPMLALGSDAEFTIYPPGSDLSSDPRAVWWHSAPEVGATSTGTAGLELTTTSALTFSPSAQSYIFSGYTIAIPSGAGEFPADWETGINLRIEVKYPYTVTDSVGVGVRDVINGDIAQLGLTAGQSIEITGDNAGFYLVHSVDNGAGTLTLSYPNGDPVTSLKSGSVSMCIGPKGLLYTITALTSLQITLDRLNAAGNYDPLWPGFSGLSTGFVPITVDNTTSEGGWVGPFAACPEGETTDTVETDVFFPGGIIFIGDDGWIAPPFYGVGVNIVTVEYQFREMGSGAAWNSVTKQYSNNTLDQLGVTETFNLGSSYRPEFRFRRIGAKSTNPQVQDTVQLYGLRSKLQAPTSYDGVTVIAIKVAGGNRIAAQAEQQVSLEVTRKLPVYSGGTWSAPTATRDIAPWIAYVAKSIGYTDDDLDLDELERLGNIWSARQDYYDNSVQQATTAKDEFNDALRAGFAEMTISRGLLKPVRDEPRSTFEHMYTTQNMTDPLVRDFKAITGDDFDGVDVEYTDSRTWQVETVECRLPGDLGLRVEKIQLAGVTDRNKAWRIGMRQRRASKYRRYSYSTATELDALNSNYMSYVALADDVPGYGQTALVDGYLQSGAGHIIRSTERLNWQTGQTHVLALRKPDGKLSGPYTAQRVDDYSAYIEGLDFAPNVTWDIEPPHILFGTQATWTYPALVTQISPNGDNTVSITAINYDERVYADDDGTAPS